MIARIWEGRVPMDKADAYGSYVSGFGVSDYQRVPGNLKACGNSRNTRPTTAPSFGWDREFLKYRGTPGHQRIGVCVLLKTKQQAWSRQRGRRQSGATGGSRTLSLVERAATTFFARLTATIAAFPRNESFWCNYIVATSVY